ncbi:MAG: HK97 family phage prohead protease [Sphingomonadaceae bacterium]|uniref:HK97 family phage prohead protease n=1 Tax=Thermaurantiacus sp. TaxID=2820283 RepID=UPI00298EE657|nr:HK97 family phage prohead protease [Thermaurantiacus sp.]MCS6987760.1 HK97 family phage prohead protease [Sphingomonadaceae bacterium]MDW8415019.1 HK97 family phage prohead protease [Thermaurantiacus sp.]
MSELVRVRGYVSLFDTPDRAGDIVRRGAFAVVPNPLPLLWQHDLERPIGRVLSLVEDARGLRMEAGIAPDCRDGRDALTLMRSGAVTGLSFGYRVKRARATPGGGRELLRLELLECSVVTLPMHQDARITGIQG